MFKTSLLMSAIIVCNVGCAGLLKKKKNDSQANEFKVTLAQVEKAKREAEADPILRSVDEYAELVAAYGAQEPAWDSKPHVASLEKLIEPVAAQAQDEYSKAKIEDLRAMIRIGARDIAGAREIYRKRFDAKFEPNAFKDYLEVLKRLSGVPAVEAECREWYGKAKDDEGRYDLAGACRRVFQTRADDGLNWLPEADRGKIREESVIRSAEIQEYAGKKNREKAREEGRIISAYYRGLVDVRVQSKCARTVTLAASAGPRTEMGHKIPISGNTAHTVVKIQADHLLWLLDDGGHRLSVARMDMWRGGLLVTPSCTDIIPMR